MVLLNKMVTLQAILAAKEARRDRQECLRRRFRLPIVSITINMPGVVKDYPILRQLCDYAVQEVKARLAVLAEERVNPSTGPEALLAVSGDPREIKAIAMIIEEGNDFGRLLDIDVFAVDGMLISRHDKGAGRQCLVCGELAVVCMREKRHGEEVLHKAVQGLLEGFSAQLTRSITLAAQQLGALAVEAMLYEVTCTPAPGLVDRNNNGAHHDMDFFSFMSSTAALSLTMARCAQAGLQHQGSLPALLPILRHIGLEGEQAMLAATGGVNTHKGLLFSLGIVTAAAGWASRQEAQPATAAATLTAVKAIVADIVPKELAGIAGKNLNALTAGERLYREYGITGIRGEMAAGLPTICRQSLPALKEALAAGLSRNDALVHTLLLLMTCVEDTTVMHRHNPDKMRIWVKTQAAAVLAAGGMTTTAGRKAAAALDAEFITHNVSPGGAADLLAVTWFLYRLEDNY
jgi:holo-ACP synthase/triphosphoribosyl-dephospho-CoA synthase